MIERRRTPGGEPGFTLVELVVALAIGAVLLALVFNGQSMLANRRLVGMARKLASDIRMVEQRARSERTCYRIAFQPSLETYDILRYNGVVAAAPPGNSMNMCNPALGWSSTPDFKEDSADTVSRRMPQGVDLVSTSFGLGDLLQFSPLGNANAGTVTMQSPSGQVRQVVLEVMGRVRILP